MCGIILVAPLELQREVLLTPKKLKIAASPAPSKWRARLGDDVLHAGAT